MAGGFNDQFVINCPGVSSTIILGSHDIAENSWVMINTKIFLTINSKKTKSDEKSKLCIPSNKRFTYTSLHIRDPCIGTKFYSTETIVSTERQ
jgi:hypothetical protein